MAMRPTSAAMRGASSSASSGPVARPGTSTRLGTGMRLGTGAGGGGGFTSSGGDVSISDRPVTQQGMSGMRSSSGRPLGSASGMRTSTGGRQVADAPYFIGLIRQRIGDISAQVVRMRGETERVGKESGHLLQLERKYEVLIKEVRALEGDLADYNLAMDKSRTSMDASEIVSYATSLKRRNEAASREVDAVFMERTERERGVARLEAAITELQRAAEVRLNSLPPAAHAEYKALAEENRGLAGEMAAMQAELERLNGQVEAAEAELRRDRVRDEYALLEKRAMHLKREKGALEEEKAATRLDPTDARDRLLAKVKEDNARIQALDREMKAVEEDNTARRKTITELGTEVEERRGDAGDRDKYEVLFKRDQEMTEFIDRFAEGKEKEVAEQRRLGHVIGALLEHMSEGMDREKAMPSREQAEEMKEDLGDKNRELKASQMTAERLGEELSLRQAELDKISTLDVKIAAELKSLEERMKGMREEMVTYADLDGLKAASMRIRSELEAAAAEYAKRRDLLRQQVQLLSSEHDRRRAAVASDAQHKDLERVEAKLKNTEQAVFALRDFMASKAKETDYESLRTTCVRLAAEVNLQIQQAQLAFTSPLGGSAAALRM